jgi:signal transduction histidine kinase
LLGQAELGGVQVRRDISGAVDLLPAVVSREAYRIVQESMTNAVRHASGTPVSLRVEAAADRLELEITNPLPEAQGTPGAGMEASRAPDAEATRAPEAGTNRAVGVLRQRANGGSGLRGIEERVAALGGSASTGPVRGEWRVRVELPL